MKKNNKALCSGQIDLFRDGGIAFVLGVVLGVLSLVISGSLDTVLFGLLGGDFWFQADIARVHYNMIDAASDHFRTNVHPLFSLMGYFPTRVVHNLFNLSLDSHLAHAVRGVIAAVAFLWMGCLYVLLRLLTLKRLDAVLFALLAGVSSASLFWFSVPETYSFGSLAILSALIVAAAAQYGNVATPWFVVVGVASMGTTLTNWMAALVVAFINLDWWKAVRVMGVTFVLVVLLWFLEKQLFPSAQFFIGNSGESSYMFREEAGGLLHRLVAFFSFSMVMPDIELVGKLNNPAWKIFTIQHALPASGSRVAGVAVFSWCILLAAGLWQLAAGALSGRMRLSLGLIVLGQLLLHLVYGEETFLYALHYLPLLVLVAALGTLGRARRIILFFVVVLIGTAGFNNFVQFNHARTMLMHHFYPEQGNRSQAPHISTVSPARIDEL